MNQKVVRYGIMGAASIVPRIVAGIHESPNSEVVAIAARSLAKAKQAADQFNIPQSYGSYVELCEDDNVDVIYVPLFRCQISFTTP